MYIHVIKNWINNKLSNHKKENESVLSKEERKDRMKEGKGKEKEKIIQMFVEDLIFMCLLLLSSCLAGQGQ